ncbi:hypothetical protein [Frankia sp. CcWB2]
MIITVRVVDRQAVRWRPRAGCSARRRYRVKEALLAAIAARELERQGAELATAMRGGRTPEAVLRMAMHHYITWALEYPARFRLVFGAWSIDSRELSTAA